MMAHIDNVIETDGALVLGAGIAGLFTALKLAPFPALVLAGSRPGVSGSSAWAQGGIAAAVGEGDDWRSHAADTMAAGAGLCDPQIVDLVAREAPDAHRRSGGDGRALRPRRQWRAGAGARSGPFPRPHRACRGRSGRRGNLAHLGGARVGDALHQDPGRLPCRRAGDGGWPRRRPFRPSRHGRRCAAGAVQGPGGDLRHRRAGRALCRHHQSAGSRAAKAWEWRRAPAP